MDKKIEKRPWGSFEQFCKNELCTVKLLNVSIGQELSLQYHKNRNEFWHVVAGKAKFIIGDKIFDGTVGDEFIIEHGVKHRIRTEDSAVQVLEISFGKFDENDIVRIEDRYDRA